MDSERRSIIVQEIKHWKRSKLLPDQYCDFLLNLYRDPETDQVDEKSKRYRAITDGKPMYWLLLIGCIALICYISLHFSAFPPVLQIGILLTATIVCLGASAWFRDRKALLSHSLFGVGSLIMLMGGSLWLMARGENGWNALTAYVSCCSLIWVVLGLSLRMAWAHFCGWVGLYIGYAVLMNRLLDMDSWVSLQLGWLPLAFLFGWIAWILSSRAKQAGAVFMILACLLWFAPEAYALIFTELGMQAIQIFLYTKLIVLGGVAYASRKTWMEWVVQR